ncbi:MAG: hypothetical protein ABIU84_14550, partial [Thermoanaerobaculia bacterium]
MLSGLFRLAAPLLALTVAASAEPPGAASGVAHLTVPAGAETSLKVVASLPVSSVLVARGEPVTKGALLVQMDVRSLERAVGEARDRLAVEQKQSRGASSMRTPPARSNTDQLTVNQDEMAAMSDLL